ncbi:MAG TPA: tRNA (adenosine(37)-N6)-threonylcarbamoyltransferase complex dimerization subunit type 1 TsaB [Xanthomonadaceae bacterium]|nr:tRNA (adenosine(37)-N6)-threonylcarbamoyltransferase complex dimerization subunit type 1 TsaB [Xanthomonadaceae bacterium]
MKLLAIETATEACSVALWIDGDLRERYEVAPRRHAELVLPWADALLAEAGIAKSQLDAIAVGRGPGAFTGVRLAIALAQGMALALDRPVIPVSTLAALAMHGEGQRIVAAIDARMSEIYVGTFARAADGLVTAIDTERLARPDAIVLPEGRDWIGIGSGFAADDGALVKTLGDRLLRHDATALPHAADVVRLAARAYANGEAVAPELAEPAYLRDKVALTLAEQSEMRSNR